MKTWWSSRHQKYKARDKARGQEYDLTLEQAKALMSLPCFYCTKSESRGLDRISNSFGHVLVNVVPCCFTCNMIVASLPYPAKLELREGLRNIYVKKSLGDWRPPFSNTKKEEKDEKESFD